MGLAERVGNALAKARDPRRLARGRSSGIIIRVSGFETPSSRAIEVIATSGSPQATTQEKGSRSFSTFTAKPWVEIPRETCTPIEAILRGPTHTPV